MSLPDIIRQNLINHGFTNVPPVIETSDTGWKQGNLSGSFPLDKNGKPMVSFQEYPVIFIEQGEPVFDGDNKPLLDGSRLSVEMMPNGNIFLMKDSVCVLTDAKVGIHFKFI